jgi:alginate O-acetyltransferase complex protein AlgI
MRLGQLPAFAILTEGLLPWLQQPEGRSFCSPQFFAFFATVFAVYWLMPWRRARVGLLLAASFAFYAFWNVQLALLVTGTTVLDFLLARGMETPVLAGRRRLLLIVSLSVNLGLLCYFKYTNFFLHSLEEALTAAGFAASLPTLRVIVPFGISFYTFEAISYTTDVYRRRILAERDLAHFLLFILFFPHLIAGPIVRARDFLPQIRRPKHWDWVRLQLGVQLFLLGVFKKLAIADRMGQHFVEPVFADPGAYRSGAIWMAVVAYALQIYADFSGYTDMAIGAAHMLGYKLMRNFNLPYLAVNVSDFWRRWHISLSSWLRDYLFIPMGGSRGSNRQTNRNLLVTMTLGGLWHGANWTFIIWGALHGMFLIVHRSFRGWCEVRPRVDRLLLSPPGTFLRIGFTFLCVCVGWVFFRADNFATAATILARMLTPHAGLGTPIHDGGLWYTVAVVAVCHVIWQRGWWHHLALRLPAPVLGLSYALVLTLALLLAPNIGKTFLYFQF